MVARSIALGRGLMPTRVGEAAGLALFDVGVWMVYEPLAVMLAGIGITAWFIGRKLDA